MLACVYALILTCGLSYSFTLSEWEEAVLLLTGATSMEELDADELASFQEWSERPLCLNQARPFSLRQSGLLSEYQCAVLEDYRARLGDILSFEELSNLDGFSPSYVRALRHFISLESNALVAHSSMGKARIRNEGVLRLSHSGTAPFSMAGKYRFSWGEQLLVGVGTNARIDEKWSPQTLHLFVSGTGNKYLEEWVVGDFNARFNQGLCLWSGFSLSGFSSVSSFLRKPTALSPYWSYGNSTSLRGAAVSFKVQKWSFSALANVSGLLKKGRLTLEEAVFLDIKRRVRSGYFALTGGLYPVEKSASLWALGARVSLAAHHCFYGWDVFGEACIELSNQALASVVGVNVPLMEDLRAALSLRYYHPDFPADRSGAVRAGTSCANEAGLAIGGQYKQLSWTLDACLHPKSRDKSLRHTGQIKSVLTYSYSFPCNVELSTRAALRFRNYGEKEKYDFRLNGKWQKDIFSLSAGLSLCHCERWGVLGHCEQALIYPWGSFYLKESLFSAPQWADRLYLYERDAPGSFSVPAYYGKGWGASFYAMGRLDRNWKLYAKADARFLTYKGEKKFTYGVKLQVGFSF